MTTKSDWFDVYTDNGEMYELEIFGVNVFSGTKHAMNLYHDKEKVVATFHLDDVSAIAKTFKITKMHVGITITKYNSKRKWMVPFCKQTLMHHSTQLQAEGRTGEMSDVTKALRRLLKNEDI